MHETRGSQTPFGPDSVAISCEAPRILSYVNEVRMVYTGNATHVNKELLRLVAGPNPLSGELGQLHLVKKGKEMDKTKAARPRYGEQKRTKRGKGIPNSHRCA
ncbi:hypothetical protein PILCRDRAFT_822413 [Piloderma croceum F 1598]|uniref:Uncharacterized protein n=1 Tax=Piloderma croceum (strain F 1598) TaxID=765440 RepID=A0A0C3FN51_PILCF|nr:hypothetical protein PILCRDRAFT_822413 [Piloderma croceum F 1598]